MKYLAIDTSGNYLTVAARGKKRAVVYDGECLVSHSVKLMDAIEKCLSEAEMTLSDADVIACSVGPGSFTGIRIGVATAKAFSYATGKKVLPVTSFESLAYNIMSGAKKLTLIDAAHGNYYACGFSADNEVVLSPRFISGEEIKNYTDYEIITDKKTDFAVGFVANSAVGFVEAVESKLGQAVYDREALVPLYVKKSQAEEESCG